MITKKGKVGRKKMSSLSRGNASGASAVPEAPGGGG